MQFLFIVLFMIITGCAATITSFTDKDTNAHITRMRGNRLSGGFTSVELNAQRFEKNDAPTYSLIIVYSGPTFISIDSGKTLSLFIDGNQHDLQGKGSSQNRNTISIGLVEEKAYYHEVDPGLIRSLAHAKEVEVEIHGAGKVLKRHFKAKNFFAMREFYDLFVAGSAGS